MCFEMITKKNLHGITLMGLLELFQIELCIKIVDSKIYNHVTHPLSYRLIFMYFKGYSKSRVIKISDIGLRINNTIIEEISLLPRSHCVIRI